MNALCAAALEQRILAVLGDTPAPFNVAAVGCGDGRQCEPWAARGHRVFGIDSDGVQVALARRRAAAAGHDSVFDVASACALPWPDRSMDLVLAGAVLDDAVHWRACLAELVRVLRPGGALCLGAGQQAALNWSHRSHWSGLSARLAQHGLASLDHVDLAGLGAEGRARRAAFALLRAVPPLRLCAQMARPDAGLLAFKAA